MTDYQIVPIPRNAWSRGQYKTLIEAVQAAPSGQAIRVPYNGELRTIDNYRQSVRAALLRGGIDVGSKVDRKNQCLYIWRKEG